MMLNNILEGSFCILKTGNRTSGMEVSREEDQLRGLWMTYICISFDQQHAMRLIIVVTTRRKYGGAERDMHKGRGGSGWLPNPPHITVRKLYASLHNKE